MLKRPKDIHRHESYQRTYDDYVTASKGLFPTQESFALTGAI